MITKAQSLDNFIDKSLYEKNKGYYQRKVEFGRRGDFITSPGISKLFSEMIAIWVVSFWENLNKPEKINLVELGAGNGELIEVLINTLNKLEIVKDKFTVVDSFYYEGDITYFEGTKAHEIENEWKE